MTTDECCGTCQHHFKDANGEWVCGNKDSEHYTDWTNYKDSCGDWEGRESARESLYDCVD